MNPNIHIKKISPLRFLFPCHLPDDVRFAVKEFLLQGFLARGIDSLADYEKRTALIKYLEGPGRADGAYGLSHRSNHRGFACFLLQRRDMCGCCPAAPTDKVDTGSR